MNLQRLQRGRCPLRPLIKLRVGARLDTMESATKSSTLLGSHEQRGWSTTVCGARANWPLQRTTSPGCEQSGVPSNADKYQEDLPQRSRRTRRRTRQSHPRNTQQSHKKWPWPAEKPRPPWRLVEYATFCSANNVWAIFCSGMLGRGQAARSPCALADTPRPPRSVG